MIRSPGLRRRVAAAPASAPPGFGPSHSITRPSPELVDPDHRRSSSTRRGTRLPPRGDLLSAPRPYRRITVNPDTRILVRGGQARHPSKEGRPSRQRWTLTSPPAPARPLRPPGNGEAVGRRAEGPRLVGMQNPQSRELSAPQGRVGSLLLSDLVCQERRRGCRRSWPPWRRL